MKNRISWSNHFIELLIVIIGISIAFWLNNLAVENKENNLEKNFIAELKVDLKTDSARLGYNIAYNEQKIEVLVGGLNLLQTDLEHQYADSLITVLGYIGNYDFFNSESFTLNSLLQSGDFKLINSSELKKELLRLLKMYELIDWNQKNHLDALDRNYFPLLITKLDMMSQQTSDPDFFYQLEIKNYCAFTINDMGNLVRQYQQANAQVTKLLQMMEGT